MMIVSQVNISCIRAQIIYMASNQPILPYREFKWLNQKEIDRFDVNVISENNSYGLNIRS